MISLSKSRKVEVINHYRSKLQLLSVMVVIFVTTIVVIEKVVTIITRMLV